MTETGMLLGNPYRLVLWVLLCAFSPAAVLSCRAAATVLLASAVLLACSATQLSHGCLRLLPANEQCAPSVPLHTAGASGGRPQWGSPSQGRRCGSPTRTAAMLGKVGCMAVQWGVGECTRQSMHSGLD